MNTQFSLLGLSLSLIASLVMPLSAHAYLTPDQVFGGGSSNTQTPHAAAGEQFVPPTQREGEEVVRLQQERAAKAREDANKQNPPVDAIPDPVDTYVPDQEPESKGLFDEAAQYEKRQDRIDESQGNGPTIIIGGDTTVRDANGNVLHSGAPLVTATGPTSVLAMAAMVLAGVSTFAYMQIRTRKLLVTA